MWWGGGAGDDDEPRSGDSSGDGSTPPVDIMEEEEAAAASPGATSSFLSDDAGDLRALKDQFAMQEDLLGQLTNVLKSNEEKLHNKEKEVQDYAMKLSKSKQNRLTSPMMRSVDSVFTTSSPVSIPGSDSNFSFDGAAASSAKPPPAGGGGKISQLKKQLEAAKIKEADEQKTRTGLENLVKQLQQELEESNAMINTLHEQMSVASVASFQTSPIHSPFVMSPESGSPERTPPLGRSVDSSVTGFLASGYAPFTDKDNKILELQEKNIDLERKLLDMEESLRAKEEVVRARTAAVTLMSADLSAKGKSTLDQLEDTRTEMRKMQANFAEQEAQWREKSSVLEVDVANKTKRLKGQEEALNKVEAVRMELAMKNAALQEKVVNLQSDIVDLKESRRKESEASYQFEEKMKEKIVSLERTIDVAERIKNDRKEEFVESIREILAKDGDSDLADKIVELENKITELEEEKGNLQLRLVDLEDLSANEDELKSQKKELEEKLSNAEGDLAHYKAHTETLETERSQLLEDFQQKETELNELKTQFDTMVLSNEDMSLSKVKLEMKAVELEEQRDRLEAERNEIEEGSVETKKYLEDTMKALVELQRDHKAMGQNYQTLQEEKVKWEASNRLHDEDMVEKGEIIKEQKIAIAQLEKSLEEKTNEILDQLMLIESQKEKLTKQSEELDALNNQLEAKEAENVKLSSLLDENAANEQIKELQSQLSQLTRDKDDLVSSKSSLEVKSHDLESKLAELTEQLGVSQNENMVLQSKLDNLQSALDESEAASESLKRELETMTTAKSDLDKRLVSLEEKNSSMAESLEELQMQNSNKDGQIEQLKAEAARIQLEQHQQNSESQEANNAKFEELTNQIAEQEDQLRLLAEQLKERDQELKKAREGIKMTLGDDEQGLQLQNELEQLAIMSQNMKSLQQQLCAKDDNIQSLQEEVESLRHAQEEVQQQRVASTFAEPDSAEDDRVQELSDERDKLKAKNDALTEKCKKLLAKCKQQESQLEANVQRDDNENNESKKVISNLKEQVEALEAENVKVAAELTITMTEKDEEVNVLNERLEDQELELSKARDDLQIVIDQSKCWQERNLQLQGELENLTRVAESLESLQLEVQSKDDTIKKLQVKVKSLQSDLEQQKELSEKVLSGSDDGHVVQELMEERNKLKSKNDALLEKCKKLLAKCKQQESKLEAAEAQNTKSSADQQETILNLRQHVEQLQSENAILSEQEAELKERAENLAEARGRVAEEVQILHMQLQDKDANIEQLQREVHSLQQVQEEVKQQSVASAFAEPDLIEDTRVQELSDERDKLKSKNEALTEKCKKLLAKCKQQEAKIAKKSTDDDQADDYQEEIISSLRQQVETLEAEKNKVAELTAELSELETEKSGLEKRLEDSQQEKSFLAEDRDRLQVKNNEKEEQLQQLKMEVAQAHQNKDNQEANSARVEVVANQVHELENELQSLTQQLQEREEDLRKAETAKAQLEQHQQNVESQEDNSDQIQELTKKVSEQEGELRLLGEQLREREEDLRKAREGIKLAFGEVCHGQDLQLHDELERLAIMAENMESLQQQLRAKDDNIDQLQKDIEEHKIQVDSLETENAKVGELTMKMAEKDVQLNLLNQQLKDCETELRKAQDNIQLAADENKSRQEQNLLLQDELASLTIVAENLESLQQQIRIKDENIIQLQDQVDTLRAQVEQQQQQEVLHHPQQAQQPPEHVQDNVNQPPPDVTQYQNPSQPDIASVQPSQQPDIMMPAANVDLQASPFDLVQDQPQLQQQQEPHIAQANANDWGNIDDDGWGDQGAQGWFDNVQQQPQQEPQSLPDLQPVQVEKAPEVQEVAIVQEQPSFDLTAQISVAADNQNQDEPPTASSLFASDSQETGQAESANVSSYFDQLGSGENQTVDGRQASPFDLVQDHQQPQYQLPRLEEIPGDHALDGLGEDAPGWFDNAGLGAQPQALPDLQPVAQQAPDVQNAVGAATGVQEAFDLTAQQVPNVVENQAHEQQPAPTASSLFSSETQQPQPGQAEDLTSYFDQFNAGEENKENKTVTPEAETSTTRNLFESSPVQDVPQQQQQPAYEEQQVLRQQEHVLQQSQPLPVEAAVASENLEWYATQLAQYQQAIQDWQAWSEGQKTEMTTLQESLAHYTAAYNHTIEELERLKVEAAAASAVEDNGGEVDRLKTALKAKEIEIQDINETVERLIAEKSDLEQEVSELAAVNQSLQSEKEEAGDADKIDYAIYDEVRLKLDEASDKLAKLEDTLSSQSQELGEAQRSKGQLELELTQAQSDAKTSRDKVANLETDLARLNETCDQLTNQVQEANKEAAENEARLLQTQGDLEDQKAEVERLQKEVEGQQQETKEVSDENVNGEAMTELKSQLESAQQELEQSKTYLQDWNVWAEQKTAEYNTLLTAYNQLMPSEQKEGEATVGSEEKVDIALYNEVRQKLEEASEKLVKLEETLSSQSQELEEAQRLKGQLEMDLAKAQSDAQTPSNKVLELETELAKVNENCEQLTQQVQEANKESAENQARLLQAQDELENQKAEVERLQKAVEEIPESTEPKVISDDAIASEDMSELKSQLEATKTELEQSKGFLHDWNSWAEKKNEEYNTLLAAYNQYVEAHDKLAAEATELKEASADLTEQLAKTSEALEAKEKELYEVKNSQQAQVQEEVVKQATTTTTTTTTTTASLFEDSSSTDNKGWSMEEDLFQTTADSEAPDDNSNAVLELEAEISDLKARLRQEAEEKAKLNEELTAAKVKHGKLTMKVKQLTKDLNSRKSMSPAASSTTSDDSLDKAIMDEMGERAKRAEKEAADLKKEKVGLEAEKAKLLDRIDTLENGNERFMELKEQQDREVQLMIMQNSELQNKLDSFEWQVSEKEQTIGDLEMQVQLLTEQLAPVSSSGEGSGSPEDVVLSLKMEVATLKKNIVELESDCASLRGQVDQLQSALKTSEADKVEIEEKLDALQNDYDNAKMLLDSLQSEKKIQPTMASPEVGDASEEYASFQKLNQGLQEEILSLRSYISQQQEVNAQLQKQLQSGGEEEQRSRHESMSSADRDHEIRKIFLSSEAGEAASMANTSDLAMQNERLKYDLDRSVGERKMLAQQMENWKRQLESTGDDEAFEAEAVAEGSDDDDGEEEDPGLIRAKQKQAYRSVAALQLRVEELTLEVTKLLEERDMLQLKLSNVMRQYERHKESTSRASTARSTPIPWVDTSAEVKELKLKIEELSRLNYSLDIELQKERGSREQMQAKLRMPPGHGHHGTPKRTPQSADRSSMEREDRDSPVIHI